MKKALTIIIFTIIGCTYIFAQAYPFQNTNLPDDERLDNLISLMTLEEKINHLSPFLRGVPRVDVNSNRMFAKP